MRIHFIAIGGAAMHNLALALHKKGYEVSGSDDEIFDPSKSRLKEAGLLPLEYGWYPEKISGNLDVIILGMHARKDNLELLEAQSQGLKIYSYPEFLYEQTKDKKRVVIGGSHGKTTITSMVMHVLKECGMKFDYMVGSQIEGFDTMVSLSEDTEVAVFEGDEYLSSPIDLRPKFHLYKPNIGLINGIAWDHINVFPTYEIYKAQFEKFINLIEDGGTLLFNEVDKETVGVVEDNTRTDITVESYNEHRNKIEDGICYLLRKGSKKVPLHVFGHHNMQNLSGAKSICKELGIDETKFYDKISSFKGSKKRLEKLYDDKNTVVYLDFAHAPSKVKATVTAVTEQYPNHEIVACLELHTFSSLSKQFLEDYKSSLDLPDRAIVYFDPDVVRHKQLPDISIEDVKKAFQREDIEIVISKTNLLNLIDGFKTDLKRVYLFMSSGNFGGIQKSEMVQVAAGK